MKLLKKVAVLFLCCSVLQSNQLKADSRPRKNQLDTKHIFGLLSSNYFVRVYNCWTNYWTVMAPFEKCIEGIRRRYKIMHDLTMQRSFKQLDYKKILAMRFEPQKTKEGQKAP